ncbi:MAG: glycerol-3-phosphate 1-O-acyltransferase PlsY [Clostridia bacterium]|nr:glycerol-3-phosphate 1-O-acyltransferase PlsY [Clostridia bacterium]
MISLFTDPLNIVKMIAVMVVAYLLGSLNIAIIVTKAFTGEDIRKLGSGNGGFTNVMRSVGTTAGIITFIGDFLKCVISVIIGGLIFKTMNTTLEPVELVGYGKYLAGMCCFLGHVFPIYFGFKGGKGVVTVAALLAVINPLIFAIAITAFLIIFVSTRIVSISSIISGVVVIIATFLVTYFYNYRSAGTVPFEYVVVVTTMTFVICGSVIAKHHANIVRLIHGDEKKLTLKKKEPKENN